MNWEMISAVGQMLGALGVIISIVYLAAQIRNQNKESQRAAMNVLTTHWSDLNRILVESPTWPRFGSVLCNRSTSWMVRRS
jgi:heme/copper-type cytochrome/quinol oxidase subunit 1